MKNIQKGFTLVELVIAVALVGVLSVVAIPKITGVSDDARVAALKGVAGALSSASVRNYAIRGANNANGYEVTQCEDVVDILEGGVLPQGFELAGTDGVDPVAAEAKVECTLSTTTTPVQTTTYTAYGIA